jgi:anti-anti-sigma factor
MNITTQKQSDCVRLVLAGRFDHTTHKLFRDSYDPHLHDNAVTTLEIDLHDVDYVDSAALGMLLLMKERASVQRKSVVLTNCSGVVNRVFKIANFDKLFTIT